MSAGCQDEFRLEIAPPENTQAAVGTYAFSVVVEGTSFQATCTIVGPDEMGCTKSTPEIADASKQPAISAVRSVEGFESFAVWFSGTPQSVSVVLQRGGKTLLDKSVTPVYDQVRASPECPVACESFQEKVQWKEPG